MKVLETTTNDINNNILQRLLLLEKYKKQIDEIELIRSCIAVDLKRIYQEIPYSKRLYDELRDCRNNNDKKHQKLLNVVLNLYLGADNFKYNYDKIYDYNFGKSYGIEFTYNKRIFIIYAVNPNMIEPSDFYNGKNWTDDFGISLYERTGENSVKLLGSALIDTDLRKLIETQVLRKEIKC